MSKYTPGPWVVEEDDYGDEHWLGGEGRGQIFVNGFVSGGCKNNPADWEKLQADANLIAAAPDLLEALLQMEEFFRGYQNDDSYTNAMFKKARAAILKAKGE